MMPIELNQIRIWNSMKYPSHREMYGQIFIVISINKPDHELDEQTCDIKYISPAMKGLVVRQYFLDYVERNSEILDE